MIVVDIIRLILNHIDEGFTNLNLALKNRTKSSQSPYYIPASKKWRSVFNECRDRLGCLGNDEADLKKAWKSVAEDLVRAPVMKSLHQEREVIDDVLKGVDLDQAKKIAKDKKKLQEYLSKVCGCKNSCS